MSLLTTAILESRGRMIVRCQEIAAMNYLIGIGVAHSDKSTDPCVQAQAAKAFQPNPNRQKDSRGQAPHGHVLILPLIDSGAGLS